MQQNLISDYVLKGLCRKIAADEIEKNGETKKRNLGEKKELLFDKILLAQKTKTSTCRKRLSSITI